MKRKRHDSTSRGNEKNERKKKSKDVFSLLRRQGHGLSLCRSSLHVCLRLVIFFTILFENRANSCFSTFWGAKKIQPNLPSKWGVTLWERIDVWDSLMHFLSCFRYLMSCSVVLVLSYISANGIVSTTIENRNFVRSEIDASSPVFNHLSWCMTRKRNSDWMRILGRDDCESWKIFIFVLHGLPLLNCLHDS